ncbi:MAG: lactate racemase domain-containing protein [Gemmataceae bacterium]|nr:lactate racemase domain-containing protein [Gemmataceae bacterium]MDW8243005.1 lactate racemase domain-containing protein [Thermogemmata sp.]
MQLRVGESEWVVEVAAERCIPLRRQPVVTPVGSPGELMRAALEQPRRFVPLRQALTPDDRVAIVLDATLPAVGELLQEVIAHVRSAGVAPEAVTILTPPQASGQWQACLPSCCRQVNLERHDPSDRSKLAYLASTARGRRLYLNRTLVDADFVIVLSGRRYDPRTGYGGAETSIFPDLADAETRSAFASRFYGGVPEPEPDDLRSEAAEVVGLLGVPLFVQVIEGEGDQIQEVIAGLAESCGEGIARQDARWRAAVGEPADTAIATISGTAERLRFVDLALAAATAARIVRPGGRVALLTQAAPELGAGAQLLCALEQPQELRQRLEQLRPDDWSACRLWLQAVQRCSLFLASRYPDSVVEQLRATPLHSPQQLQRLLDAGGKVTILPDAHKLMVTY